jgi:hypothetical protein
MVVDVGDTMTCDPSVTPLTGVTVAAVVKLEFVYHFHVAPAPKDPPTSASVVELPRQILVPPVRLAGAVDALFTVKVAAALVSLPAVLLTMQRNVVPLSFATTGAAVV